MISLNTLVVGSGAAAYHAALSLWRMGNTSVAIVTEGINMGTSRNTGSDKQTYYKLGLAGDRADSVHSMAADLFACGSTDGDTALAEAALSTRCFLNLCELGVPFPTNRYGEYVGYKTDHDPCARATSVGPLTSKEMTEKLQAEAERLHIPVYDGIRIVSLVKKDNEVCGAVGLNKKTGDFVPFCAANVVWCTGGPGGIYRDSVYPLGHTGSTGVLFEAGATGQNLTYWQYGLASVAPRWNVSGSYMQVLPRFVSVDKAGTEHEFLTEYFKSEGELLSAVFLKGYQWPFDSRKVLNGSSVIDLLVYRETVMRDRRVFLDFTHNPYGKEVPDFASMLPEAKKYLSDAGILFGTPLERLQKLNRPAIDLYRSKGTELDYLEVAVCAQHNNGGIKVDLWWQSELKHLFVCGEAAGTHGISRPGGSALNAGQVGSLRAAQYIQAHQEKIDMSEAEFASLAAGFVPDDFASRVLANPDTADSMIQRARARMSAYGGMLREKEKLRQALAETQYEKEHLASLCGVKSKNELIKAFVLKDMLSAQAVYLSAMLDYASSGYGTSGSALYYDAKGQLRDGLDECFRFCPDDGKAAGTIQEITPEGKALFRPVRPLPEGGGFFETVWRDYRENKNFE